MKHLEYDWIPAEEAFEMSKTYDIPLHPKYTYCYNDVTVSDINALVDLIQSGKTPKIERDIAPHPSLKPQNFMRKIVFASLPTGKGIVLDTFAGAGSTVAAAIHCGYDCIGIERDEEFHNISKIAVPKLAALYPNLFMQTANVSVSAKRQKVSHEPVSSETLF